MSSEKIQPFQALSFDLQQAGKHMKSTKKKYIWKFKLGNKEHELMCSTSHITGKLKILLDGRVLLQGDLVMGQPYQHSMMVNGHLLTIQKNQNQTKFGFSVDNKDFLNQLSTTKGNEAFRAQEAEIEDVQVTKNFGLDPNKKITLNIAAMGDGMKKKKNAVESQNWKQISKNEGISYFKAHQDIEDQKDSDDEQVQSKSNLNDLKIEHLTSASPQQFSTLQILFGTVNNVPTPQKNVHQKKQENKKQPSAIQLLNNSFNTMQNLFSTQVPPNPTIPSTNIGLKSDQQFTTMQALFATSTPQNIVNAKSINNMKDIKQLLKIDENSLNDFNTMQNLFSTNAQGLSQIQKQNQPSKTTPQEKQTAILQEFNTMQNLFATGNLTPQFLDPKNFGTIQGKAPLQPSNQQQTATVQTKMDPLNYQNFSTMQQLFATNQLKFPPPPSSNTPTSFDAMSVLNQCTGIPTTSTIPPISESQFNTLQDLFKTGKLNLDPNSNPLS